MKKLKLLLNAVILLSIIFTFITACGNNGKTGADVQVNEKTDVESKEKKDGTDKITVLTEEYPPLNYTNVQGQVDGIATQKVKKAFEKLSISVDIQVLQWKRAYEMMKDGENVFLYSCARTPQREKEELKWVYPLADSDTTIVALKDRNIKVSKLDDLKNYILAGRQGYRYVPYLAENGIKEGEKLELIASDESNIQKLFSERVDALIGNSLQIEYLVKKLNYDYTKIEKVFELEALKTETYLVTGKKTSDEFIEKVKNAFEP